MVILKCSSTNIISFSWCSNFAAYPSMFQLLLVVRFVCLGTFSLCRRKGLHILEMVKLWSLHVFLNFSKSFNNQSILCSNSDWTNAKPVTLRISCNVQILLAFIPAASPTYNKMFNFNGLSHLKFTS